MAFDGITVSCIVKELNDRLLSARIYKISQPEPDELLLTLKGSFGQLRLLISANPSLPLVYLTEENKPSPMTAPGFCMLLRKHLSNGRIVSISQPSLERIIRLDIEHLDEMGDLKRKSLIIELMGKHSNIIFTDENDMIIDAVKHVSSLVSSVREVLPARDYFIVNTMDKSDPLSLSFQDFKSALEKRSEPLSKVLYLTFTGFSPLMNEELVFRLGLDPLLPAKELSKSQIKKFYELFNELMENIKKGSYRPCIVYKGKDPVEYFVLEPSMYSELNVVYYPSVSEVLYRYYKEKALHTRMRQKSADLRRIVSLHIERSSKKLDLQKKQLKDTGKMDKYKIWGELINTYGYSLPEGSKELSAIDYHTNENILIPLDATIPVLENAKKYFSRYNKLKRTKEALLVQVKETEDELKHLQSVSANIDMAVLEEDLSEIKDEMTEAGYIKKHSFNKKKKKVTSKPLHYLSSDNYHMYVGKNNYQNDELTFNFASGNDLWFHSKKFPGSHVIVKTEGKTIDQLPDRLFEEAGSLAAYYSKAREQSKVEIDYVEKKQVKKPAGAKPGFVVYYTNYSLSADPDISQLTLLD
ncbi:MAG: NFACT family protein [Lachnospiraceae bacterium]|nr:NFACT family protein [Lachnospiraceae bacterium]